jgi:hypothetical protein
MRGVLTSLLLVLNLGLAIVEEEELEPVFIIVVSLVRYVASVLLVVAKSAIGVLRNNLTNSRTPARRWSAVAVAHSEIRVEWGAQFFFGMRSACRSGGVHICAEPFYIVACAGVAY